MGNLQDPAALGWLILCLIPLLVFYFFRRQPTVVPWGAFRFLHNAQEKVRRKTRFWEFFRILSQTLAIFCLVLALASPIFFPEEFFACFSSISCSDGSSVGSSVGSSDGETVSFPQKGIARNGIAHSPSVSFSAEHFCVFVVDRSASMRALAEDERSGISEPTVSRMELALRACRKRMEFLEDQKTSVKVYVLPVALAEIPEETSFMSEELRNADPSAVLGQIYGEKGTADWKGTLQNLKELFRRSTGTCAGVTVFSDFTDEASVLRDFLNGVEQLVPDAQLQMVSVGENAANLALQTLSVKEMPILKKRKTPIMIEVRSEGISKKVSVCVELTLWSVGEQGLEKSVRTEKWLTLPPDSAAELEFEVEFPETGDFLVETILKNAVSDERPLTDLFSADDSRRLPVRVKDRANFLIAEAWEAGAEAERTVGSIYLKSALESIFDARYSDPSEPSYRIDCRKDPDFSMLDPGAYDAVFLCGLSLFSPEETESLIRAAQNGTAFWFFCGPGVSEESFQPLIAILPALASGKEQRLPASEALRLNVPASEHEVSEIFRENPNAGLEEIPISRRTPLVSVSGAQIAVPLEFTDGSPFLMVRELPYARSAVCAVAADPSGSSLPLLPVWLPLVERTLHFLLSAPCPFPPQAASNCPQSESCRLNQTLAPAEIPEDWEFFAHETFLSASETEDRSNLTISLLWLLALGFLIASIGAGEGRKKRNS